MAVSKWNKLANWKIGLGFGAVALLLSYQNCGKWTPSANDMDSRSTAPESQGAAETLRLITLDSRVLFTEALTLEKAGNRRKALEYYTRAISREVPTPPAANLVVEEKTYLPLFRMAVVKAQPPNDVLPAELVPPLIPEAEAGPYLRAHELLLGSLTLDKRQEIRNKFSADFTKMGPWSTQVKNPADSIRAIGNIDVNVPSSCNADNVRLTEAALYRACSESVAQLFHRNAKESILTSDIQKLKGLLSQGLVARDADQIRSILPFMEDELARIRLALTQNPLGNQTIDYRIGATDIQVSCRSGAGVSTFNIEFTVGANKTSIQIDDKGVASTYTACNNTPPPGPKWVADPTLQTQALAALSSKCLSCHGAMGQAGVNNITNVDELISGGHIIPKDATKSPIVVAIDTGKMPPLGATPIAANEVLAIKNWINSFTDGSTPLPAPTPRPLQTKQDFNNDGRSDVVWHHQETGQVAVWNMAADFSVLSIASFPNPVSPSHQIRSVADFDNDGLVDVLIQNTATRALTFWSLNGVNRIATKELAVGTPISADWQIKATSDFNGDGWSDLVWQNQVTGEVYLWYLKDQAILGGDFISDKATAPNPAIWEIRGAGDFSKDKNADLIWHNRTTGEIYLWLMDKNRVVNGLLGTSKIDYNLWKMANIADWDDDTQPDILWHQKVNGELYVWTLEVLTINAGTFLTPKNFSDFKWRIVPH